MSQGPNVRRLIATKASAIMVPPGAGIGNALAAMAKPGNVGTVTREASDWVAQAIAVVRTASEPNPYRTADDEVIAGVLLKGIEDRKKAIR